MTQRAIFLLIDGVHYELDCEATDAAIASYKRQVESLLTSTPHTMQKFQIRTDRGTGELSVRPGQLSAAAVIVGDEPTAPAKARPVGRDQSEPNIAAANF